MTDDKSKRGGVQRISSLLLNFDWDKKKYISREFQDYGYRLAEQLHDLRHKSLYIRLAKETPRVVLEEALNFVKDANKVKSRAKLFMWKLKQIREAKEGKNLAVDKK